MNIVINDTVTLSIDWSYKVHNLKDVIKKVFMQEVIKRIKYSLDNLPKYAHATCEIHGGIHRPMDYINQCKITCRCTITILDKGLARNKVVGYYDKPSNEPHDKRVARSISFKNAYFNMIGNSYDKENIDAYVKIADSNHPIIYTNLLQIVTRINP